MGEGRPPGDNGRAMRRPILVLALVAVLAAQAAWASNDPLLPQQWALKRIEAEQAWSKSRGAGVVVAVVDTGVDFSHEDLTGKSAGLFTCVGGTCKQGGADDNGHGTKVAGVVASSTGNGKGVGSVAPDARIMSVKVLESDGSGAVEDVAQGIRFAADQGARVINLSLGTDLPLPIVFGTLAGEFAQAVQYAWNRGAVVAAAAGNGGLFSSYSGIANLYVVGATTADDTVASYSSSASGVDIHAPGGEANGSSCPPERCVTTTDMGQVAGVCGPGECYRAVAGTSFAAPHVSGVAALLLALGYTNAGAVERMDATADPVSAGRRLNAARAVGAQGGGGGGGATPSPSPTATSGPAPAPRRSPAPKAATPPPPAAAPSPAETLPPPEGPTLRPPGADESFVGLGEREQAAPPAAPPAREQGAPAPLALALLVVVSGATVLRRLHRRPAAPVREHLEG